MRPGAAPSAPAHVTGAAGLASASASGRAAPATLHAPATHSAASRTLRAGDVAAAAGAGSHAPHGRDEPRKKAGGKAREAKPQHTEKAASTPAEENDACPPAVPDEDGFVMPDNAPDIAYAFYRDYKAQKAEQKEQQ